MTSRSTSPLAESCSPHTTAKERTPSASVGSKLSGADHSPAAAPARTTKSPGLNSPINVTPSHNPRNAHAQPNDRQSTQLSHIPRGASGLSGGSLSTSTSRSPSTLTSPRSSRETSPAGRIFRQQSVPGTSSSRDMRNSQDVSPHRPPSITGYSGTVPSAAAIQRALSAATAPQLQSATTSEPASRASRSARGITTSGAPSESTTPSWPLSPRLKSPPPSGSRRNSLRTQQSAPNIVVQHATPTTSTDSLPLIDQQLERELRQSAQNAKTSREQRGVSGAPTLETVQETSGPNTPRNGLSAFSTDDPNHKYFDMPEETPPSGTTTPRRSMAPAASKPVKAGRSDSDEGEKQAGTKKAQETDPDTTPRPKVPSTRASFSSLRQQAKTVEPITRSMTVETETVNSVAQNTIGAPSDRVSSRADYGSTLRPKASNDTIKPSKSRKKATRKAPSITAAGGMYDPNLFSPPDTGSPFLISPRLRRRDKHFLLCGGGEQQQRPGSNQSASSNIFSSSVQSSEVTTLYACSEADQVPEQQPSRLQLLRQRFSQWLASYCPPAKISPIRTDSRLREGSTRADIFEDRVKNAMDEETSDDSDETFVYESNPAEPPVKRSRHHSRTPSAASLTSMGGQAHRNQGQGLVNTQKTRSMKFANAYNSADDDNNMERSIDGALRGVNPSMRGSTVHHHHTGRPSRSTTGHASILDEDGPFLQLNTVRSLTGLPGRQTQNARMAARNLHASNGNSHGPSHGYTSYDLDAEGGDDERTPLINNNNNNTGTVRTLRSIRRPPTRDQRPAKYPRRRQGMLARFAGCVAIIAMLFLLVFGIVGFLFIITTPLKLVQIYEIQSTLASETEIMFDLKVGAVNPNLLPITVSDIDLNIFAKSKYVGTEKWWREHPDGPWANEPLPPRKISPIEARRTRAASGEVPEDFLPTHPKIPGSWPGDEDDEDDDENNRQTMLLGRVFNFDSPLNFDPSFLRRHVHNSTGAIRISHPGNHTELGGSERWERVVLHTFDLIVRGTLKYTIPLGGTAYVTNVGARVTVDPQVDETPGPGEGKDPEGGGDKKKEDNPETSIASRRPKWKITVHPLEEDHDSVHERLKRRVFARLVKVF